MLEQSHSLLFDKLIDHVAKHRTDCVEALVRLTDVCQADVIE